MIEQKSLYDIIQEHIHLSKPSASGWRNTNCEVCGDRGLRFGVIHDSDTTSVHCFNCGIRAKYEEGTGKLSRNFREILEAFGITADDLTSLTSPLFLEKQKEGDITVESLNKVKLTTPEVAFPDRTLPLLSATHEAMQEPILEYLIARKIDPLEHPLYFSLDPKLLRRVIIPFWRQQKLIYWQARTIDTDVKPRYKNCVAPRDAVIYGYDQLYSYDTAPLFVNEGVFDAMIVNGISTLGASLNLAKLEVLKKTRRRLIFVVDRDQTGGEFGRTALENGYEITFVDVRAKDINDSVVKFGLPYTALSLMRNATNKANKLQSSTALELGLLEARLRRR